jgi:hypothetical protein
MIEMRMWNLDHMVSLNAFAGVKKNVRKEQQKKGKFSSMKSCAYESASLLLDLISNKVIPTFSFCYNKVRELGLGDGSGFPLLDEDDPYNETYAALTCPLDPS